MITLPRNVEKLIYSVGKNAVWRCYGQEEISIDAFEVCNSELTVHCSV